MMNIPKWIKPLFVFAGLCDAGIGILFLIFPVPVFNLMKTQLPQPAGFLHFIALFLIVLGIMYFNVAKSPRANRNLILYGMLIKLSFCLAVFWNLLNGQMQFMWFFFAIFDTGFIAAFIAAYKSL